MGKGELPTSLRSNGEVIPDAYLIYDVLLIRLLVLRLMLSLPLPVYVLRLLGLLTTHC